MLVDAGVCAVVFELLNMLDGCFAGDANIFVVEGCEDGKELALVVGCDVLENGFEGVCDVVEKLKPPDWLACCVLPKLKMEG